MITIYLTALGLFVICSAAGLVLPAAAAALVFLGLLVRACVRDFQRPAKG